MRLTGVHILLTYKCTIACDHCFVWGSPWQSGTMALPEVRTLLAQAKELGTVTSIFYEGGEPFLYYPLLLEAVREAAGLGFSTGIVSNAFWALGAEDALAALGPFAGILGTLLVSSDLYHSRDPEARRAWFARRAAEALGISTGAIGIAQPEDTGAEAPVETLPAGESAVMYRGRAAKELVGRAGREPWDRFTACPHERLEGPSRLHIDPLGNAHICQGISLGNVFETSLRAICETYDPGRHPITGPLLRGGPAALVAEYGLEHAPAYADACHLCDEARHALRARFPAELSPDQMYGVGREP